LDFHNSRRECETRTSNLPQVATNFANFIDDSAVVFEDIMLLFGGDGPQIDHYDDLVGSLNCSALTFSSGHIVTVSSSIGK
jgi:hypothetical protein